MKLISGSKWSLTQHMEAGERPKKEGELHSLASFVSQTIFLCSQPRHDANMQPRGVLKRWNPLAADKTHLNTCEHHKKPEGERRSVSHEPLPFFAICPSCFNPGPLSSFRPSETVLLICAPVMLICKRHWRKKQEICGEMPPSLWSVRRRSRHYWAPHLQDMLKLQKCLGYPWFAMGVLNQWTRQRWFVQGLFFFCDLNRQ